MRVTASLRFMRVPRLGCAAWPMDGQDRSGSWRENWIARSAAGRSRQIAATIYFTAEEAGHERVYSVPAEGGSATLVVDSPLGVYTGLDIPAKAASTMLFANWESAVNPLEIVRIDPANAKRDFPDVVQCREGRLDRLAAAARFLVHRPRWPAHSQLCRAAAELRRDEEVSAVRADARRLRQLVARRDFLSLELSLARASRLRRRC